MRSISFKYLAIGIVLTLSTSCKDAKKTNESPDRIGLEEVVKKGREDLALSNSIVGKILCGYQGWFNADQDGADLDWKHYKIAGKFESGTCSIDYWPDLTDFDKDEMYATTFKHSGGSQASVFSSAHPKTVNRHFKWMQEYDIDGVFVQRFVTNVQNPKQRANMNKVFDNCFIAANKHDRLISVMYDFSGSTNIVENTKKDWKRLVDNYELNTTKKNILAYKDKAVIALWGVGFKNRDYTLTDVAELIDFFENDPKYGNCSVLLGVPTGWRTLDRDATSNTKLHDIIKMADIVHPWTPGRYSNLTEVDNHRENYIKGDKAWCDRNGLLYMPVVFPGFSWHNLKKGLGEKTHLNAIPRLKGQFLWKQFHNAVAEEVESIYVAMFDEMDEGTCIFKVSDNPPVGDSPFLDYEGLPSDYYLWLTGKAGKMLRKEIPLSPLKPDYQENGIKKLKHS